MPDRPAQMASTVIRLGSTMRSGISRMRGPPRPCGSKGWKSIFRRSARAASPARRRTRRSRSRRRRRSGRRRRAAPHCAAGRHRPASRSGSCRNARRPPILPPASAQQTMRRATSPAIWTTATVPFGLSMTRPLRSFSLAGLVEFGVEELSRPVLDPGDPAAHRRRGSHGRRRHS